MSGFPYKREPAPVDTEAAEVWPRCTEAMRFALRLVVDMGHAEWAMYHASFKRLAALGLIRRDDEGWAVALPLGKRVAAYGRSQDGSK